MHMDGPDDSSDPVVARNGTEFESRSRRMFVIEVVDIQCSKLFKGMECAVLSGSVHYKEP